MGAFNTSRRLASTTSVGILAMVLADVAVAQAPAQAPTPPAAAPAQANGLQDIVVTARRTSENLQKVPVTITALSQSALQAKAVRDVYDLQQATPSLTVESSQSQGRSVGSYVIHGQKQAADDASPGVVAYLNDVPVGGGEVSRALFDMDSVQVLKGPQGTLFGRNTNGGAILYNTAAPTNRFEGYINGRYGNYNDRYLEAMVNVPVSDSLQIRAAGNFERRDGFTKNSEGPDLDNIRDGNARLSIRFHPSEIVDNKVVFNYTDINERGPGYQIATLTPCADGGTAACVYIPALGFDPSLADVVASNQAKGIRSAAIARPGTSQIRAFGVSDTLQFNFDNITVKNIFGFHRQKFSGINDSDSTDFTLLSVDYNKINKTLSDEFQVQGKFLDNKLNIIAGGFYYSSQEDPYCGATTDFCATSGGQVLLPFIFGSLQYEHRDDSSRALFIQGSYKLTDALTVTGGYRYTWDHFGLFDRHFQERFPQSIVPPAFPVGPGVIPTIPGVPADATLSCNFLPTAPEDSAPGTIVDSQNCTRTAHTKFSAGNYLGSIDWTAAPGVLAYATFRHGYKSGALNSTSDFSGPGFIYKPETVNDVELGLKTQHRFGGTDVRFNISGFHDWYKALQLTSVIVDKVSGSSQSLTQNVGAARLWGGEADLVVVPVPDLVLEGTFSYFDGKFTRGIITDTDGSLINLAGRHYQSQPKIAYTLSANYTFDLGNAGKLSPSVFWTWRKSYFFTYDTQAGNRIPSYGLLNARLDLRHAFGLPLDIGVFGKNITNKAYITNVQLVQAFGFLADMYGEPRTYGVEATYHFGGR